MQSFGTPDFSWAKQQSFKKDKIAGQRALLGLVDTRDTEYRNYYAPVASSLRDLATSNIDQAKISQATAKGGRLFDVGYAALEREQRGLGTGPIQRQQERMGLRRTLAEIDSGNREIAGQEERRSLAQMFAMDQYGDLMGQAGQIYGDISQMEMNRRSQFAGAKAGSNSSAAGAAGAAVGILAAFV